MVSALHIALKNKTHPSHFNKDVNCLSLSDATGDAETFLAGVIEGNNFSSLFTTMDLKQTVWTVNREMLQDIDWIIVWKSRATVCCYQWISFNGKCSADRTEWWPQTLLVTNGYSYLHVLSIKSNVKRPKRGEFHIFEVLHSTKDKKSILVL